MKVWSKLFRFFHWLTVGSVILAFVSIKSGLDELHYLFGYSLMLALIIRAYLLLLGNTFENIRAFKVIQEALHYIRTKREKKYIGHNPLAASVTALMLVDFVVIVVSGLMVQGMIEFEGIFGWLGLIVSNETAIVVKYIHKGSFLVLILCIAAHLSGLLLSYKEEKLRTIKSIFTGVKNV